MLYRHFSRWSELSLVIATEPAQCLIGEQIVEIRANQLLSRLTKTRIGRLAHSIRQCFEGFYDLSKLRQQLQHKKPDLILTVAHGELCWCAQYIAQTYRIPLITFFHDWWPDLAYVHSWTRGILERRFKQLYQRSKLAFCVTEAMRQRLGGHQNARILFPIPDQFMSHKPQQLKTQTEPFKVIYAGNLSGIYKPMLLSLCKLLPGIPELKLQLFGLPPDWTELPVQQLQVQKIYGGFIPRKMLIYELCQASALLLTMSFNQREQRRTQMSFPSKLVEYCQFGKPIIIWGPDYCSAVQWGRQYESALVVTSPSAKDLVEAIKELAHKPLEQKRLGDKASEMARGMFNPEKIQQQFIESIKQISGIKG